MNDPGIDDIIPYLPRVFEKISSNLETHLQDLEAAVRSA